MPRIYAFVNQKGGVGKTTTAINMGAFLAQQNQRVLLVDLDPQGNATSSLGVDKKNLTTGTYPLLLGEDLRLDAHTLHNTALRCARVRIRRTARCQRRERRQRDGDDAHLRLITTLPTYDFRCTHTQLLLSCCLVSR